MTSVIFNGSSSLYHLNTDFTIPDAVSAVILPCAIFLNALGIYLLYKTCGNQPPSNHTIVVAAVSTLVIMISIMEGVHLIGELSGFNEGSKFSSNCDVTIAGLFLVYYLVLCLLTLNRLMASVFIYNYRNVVSKRRLLSALLTIWIVGIIITLPFYFIEFDTFFKIWYKFIYLTLDAINLISAIVTYTYIFKTTKAREKRIKTSNQSNTSNKLVLISFLIILTFILFVTFPDIYYAYRFAITEEGGTLEEKVVMICWQINYILDPLIYIFFQNELRKKLFRKFVCLKSSHHECTIRQTSSNFSPMQKSINANINKAYVTSGEKKFNNT